MESSGSEFRSSFARGGSAFIATVAIIALTWYQELQYLILGITCLGFAIGFWSALFSDQISKLMMKNAGQAATTQLKKSGLVAFAMAAVAIGFHFVSNK